MTLPNLHKQIQRKRKYEHLIEKRLWDLCRQVKRFLSQNKLPHTPLLPSSPRFYPFYFTSRFISSPHQSSACSLQSFPPQLKASSKWSFLPLYWLALYLWLFIHFIFYCRLHWHLWQQVSFLTWRIAKFSFFDNQNAWCCLPCSPFILETAQLLKFWFWKRYAFSFQTHFLNCLTVIFYTCF